MLSWRIWSDEGRQEGEVLWNKSVEIWLRAKEDCLLDKIKSYSIPPDYVMKDAQNIQPANARPFRASIVHQTAF
jgi:hypothetical protein